ncbi:gamma-aminobutyric acid type B receptor subunit 2-like [Acanthaster planci]|uniref:Gamma-aminobutyric acid type B receptor subunit 2 n=1 Tax=Acanthaster planci TaxID=133434 RepID=A0A8B7XR63_ACAPL|nr:gamma-aminobutyric acid type B receptor subunit 2-like [Acanthaster planci]
MRFGVPPTVCLLLTIAVCIDELPELGGMAFAYRDGDEPLPVYVGGFFPIGFQPFFSSLPLTVQSAVDHVNNLTGILDGYELRMRWNWTQGSPANALGLLNDFIQNGPPVVMTWGPMFSSVAVVVNEVVPLYGIVQVVIASSTTLKDRARYPLTVQVSVDEDLLNPTRVAFVKRMGWRRVALIFEDNEYFRQNMAKLAHQLRENNITVLTTEAVTDPDNSDEQIQSLKRHDARVIITAFYPDPAAKLFCKVYKAKLFGAKYVWILPGWYPDGWWRDLPDVSCSNDEIAAALDLHVAFDGDQAVSDVSLIDFNGVKPFPEQLEYLERLHNMEDNSRDIYAYDCLFTMAMALNASIGELLQLTPPRRLNQFEYGDKNMAEILLRNTLKAEFVGLTDLVVIGEEGVRHSTVYVEQFQDGQPVRITNYLADGDYKNIPNATIRWKGSGVPIDGRTEIPRLVQISLPYQIGIFTVAGFGVLLALLFLALNIALRNQRAIKISSPLINNLIVLGCLLLYSSVFVSGLDTSGITDGSFILLCHVKVGLICVGISLSFGSLLVKTYRIFAIFQKAVARFKKIDLPDKKLIFVVLGLVLVDCIIIILWVFVGQSTVNTFHLEAQLSDTASPESETYIIPVLRQCGSNHEIYFICAIYGFKGILLVFGVFLSWENRNITVAGLNDSKYLALSVYIVGITIVLAVPALQVFVNNVDVHFCILGFAIVFANTAVLCLVFAPKFALCYSTRGNQLRISLMEASSVSMGTKSVSSSYRDKTRLSELQDELQQKRHTLAGLLADL